MKNPNFSPALFVAAHLGLAVLPVLGQDTLEYRTDMLLDSLSTRKVNVGQTDGPHRAGRTGFWTTEGRLMRNITNATTWSYLSAAISNADGSPDAGGANGGFSGWPGMDCWYRFNHLFPQNIKDQYFTEFTTMPNYHKGSTPNQKIMWAVACRLACEEWGTETATAVSDADYTRTGDKTGADYIKAICSRTIKYSFEERWAKHYLTYTMGPLRTLSDFTADATLANMARMTNNWGFADLAPINFHGRWAVPAGRGNMGGDGNTYDISEFNSWLLMGGPNPASLLDADQSCYYIMPGAPNPTLLPELTAIGNKRDEPYVTRRMARLFETQFATTYMTKDYAVYSQVEGDTTLNADGTIKIKDLNNGGVPSNDWNSERWAVFWNDAPAHGKAALTMKPPTGYGWSQGTGIGPHEDVVQHEGTIVGVLNFPVDWTWKYTRDYIPANTTAIINDGATTGRVFLHYSSVLVAITRSDIGNFTLPTASQSYTQSYSDKRGFAVETASPAEYPQATAAERLAAFKADIEAHPADLSHVNDATPRMIYTKRDGTVLDITYGQAGKINGSPVDYEAWPLSESPWTSQQQMGNMFVLGDERTLLWNYKNWTERENRRPTAASTTSVAGSAGAVVDVDLTTRVTDTETASANLKYRVTGATNGTAVLLADGKTARFTPAANFSGEGSIAFSAGDSFPDHRLIFHYDYEQADPVAGNLVTDVSSQDRHGAAASLGLAGFASDSSVPAALGTGTTSTKSLRVTGSNLGIAKISRQVHPATLNLSNGDWTFATWFKRTEYKDDDIVFYVGAGTGLGGNGDELQLFLPAQERTLKLRHYNASGVQDMELASAAEVDSGAWHHAALRFTRTAHNSGSVALFLNGQAVGNTTITWALNQTGPVFVGGPAQNSVLSRGFNGWIDDTALFRGALSAAEIRELAEASVAQLGGLKLAQSVQVRTTPPVPLSLVAEARSNVLQLSWNPSAGAASYTVKRATSAAGPFSVLATGITSATYRDASAAFGTPYFYVVSAVNGTGASADSLPASAMLPTSDLSPWNSGTRNAWSRSTRIAFPGYTRDETLVDFPVLVTIDATAIPGFAYNQLAFSSGADLRFTDASGTTELAYEIDKWNPSGTSYVWVKVPVFSKDTNICMFWGNPSVTATAQPNQISGLAMWLKADAITGLADGATVNSWPDSSGNNRNATLSAGAPVFKTSIQNGKPVVRFPTDGNSGFAFPQMTTIRTVFWVVKESSPSTHFLLGDDDKYHFHRGATGGTIWDAGYSTTSVRSGTTRLNGSTVNGTSTALGSGFRLVSLVTSGNVEASRLSKDRSISGRSWDGDVAEVIVYNRALSANEELLVGSYLAQKYALATSYVGAAPLYTVNGDTWSNGYLGVFHLRETSGAHFSSTADAAATRTTSATSQGTTTGMVGGADTFNGTSQYLSLPNYGSRSAVTIEAWLNLSSAPGSDGGGIVSADPWSTGVKHFRVTNTRSMVVGGYDSGSIASEVSAVPLGAWSHMAYTCAGAGSSDLVLYQDGNIVGTAAGSSTNDLTDLNVAREYSTRYLNANFDEVRVSSVVRSAAWLWATHANIRSPLAFNRGAPATAFLATAVPQVTTLAATAVSATGATVNGFLASTGGSTTAVTLYWGSTDGSTTPANWATTVPIGNQTVGLFSANLLSLTPGSTYFFRTFATNTSGSTWASESLRFTTPTAAPSAPVIDAGSGGSVNLSWAAVSGATNYTVKRATTNGGPFTTLLGNITGTTFSDHTVVDGTTYYYVLSAVNAGGESAHSAQTAVTTIAAPSGLVANPGNASVELSWQAVPGATGYTVKRGTSSGTYATIQSGIASTSYTDNTAVNGTRYYYVVVANSTGYASADSNEATAKPLATLAAPTGLVGVPVSGGVSLTWNAVADAFSYAVKRSTANGGPYSVIASGLPAPSFNDSGLNNGTTYYYVISATSGTINSANSAQLAIIPAVTPTTFTNTSAGNWSAVTWNPNPPGQPVAAFATTLILNNATAIASTHNLGAFLLNNLQLNNNAVTLSGDSLYFAGTSPAITTALNFAHTLANALALDTQTTVSIASNTTTLNGSVTGQGGITKSGAGTLVLGMPAAYGGATIVDGGTMRLSTGTSSLNALTFGASAGSTNTSTLDLSSASASADSLAVQTNSATANGISIGSGRSLSILGNVDIGTFTASTSSTSKLNVTGAGTLAISSDDAQFRVGTTSAGSGVAATLDLSGVSSFSLNYGSGSELVVGNGSNANTLIFAPSSQVAVESIRIADNQVASATQALKLGTGANVIHTDSLKIGTTSSPYGGGRGVGEFKFHGAAGTLTLRAANGIDGTNVSIADNGSDGNGFGTFDVNGHNADIKIHTLRMGASTNATTRTDTFSFNQGTLDIRVINIGIKQDSASFTRTSNINLGGGTVTLGQGVPADPETGEGEDPGSIVLATNALGKLTISGGAVTCFADITRAAGTGTGTLKLTGGTLDLSGRTIGGSNAVTLDLQAGTLKNIAQINNGAAFSKSGTGTLILEGTNTPTGALSIGAGSVQIGTTTNAGTYRMSSGSVQGPGTLSVATAGLLAGNGFVSAPISVNGSIAPRAGTITLQGTVTLGATARMSWGLEDNSTSAAAFGQISVTSAINGGRPVDVVLNDAGSVVDFSNVFWASTRTWPVLVATGLSGTPFTLGSVSADNTGKAAVGFGAFSVTQSSTTVSLTWTPYTALQKWRYAYFGTVENSGNAADTADPDLDGVNNLGEFNASTNPTDATSLPAYTWNNLTSGNWSQAANWTNGVAPTSNAACKLEFFVGQTLAAGNLTITNDNVETFLLNSLRLAGTGSGTIGVTLTGNALRFSTNGSIAPEITLNASSTNFTYTLANDITLDATTTIDGANSGFFHFNGMISGSGGITRTGSSSYLRLNGNNSFTGTTTLSAGTTAITSAANLGAATAPLVLDGGTLQILGTTLTSFSGLGHPVSFTPDKSVILDINNSENVFTVDQILNHGVGGFTKSGAGMVVMNQANTYTGTTTINAGVLSIAAPSHLGDPVAPLVFNGGTLRITGTALASLSDLGRDVTFTSGKSVGFDIADAANIFLCDAMLNQGSGGLTKSGSGTLDLNPGNTFTGNITISAGVLRISDATALGGTSKSITCTSGIGRLELDGAGADISLPATTTLSLSGAQATGVLRNVSGNNLVNGPIGLNQGAGNSQIITSGGSLTLAGALSATVATTRRLLLGGSATGEVAGPVSNGIGTVSVTKNGDSTWTLSAANAYTGGTTVSAGTLTVTGSGTLGSGNLTVANAATCLIENSTGAIADTASVYLLGSGKLHLASGVHEMVARLYLDGILQPAQTYTNTSHPNLVIGAGSLIVTEGVPASPSGLAATSATTSTITLGWTDNALNESGYTVERSLSPSSGFSVIASLPADSSSHSDSGLLAGTPYYYKVRATHPTHGPSTDATAILYTVCDAPTGLVATAGNAQVNLTWSAVTGAVGYKVKRSTISGSGYTELGMPATNTFTDNTAANGTTYFYGITAVNAAGGESAISNEANARPLPPAGNGFWTSTSSGNWSLHGNWQNFVVAGGSGNTATFNQNTGVTVTQDVPNLTLGHLVFANSNYTLSGGALTMDAGASTPTLSVASGRTATIASSLTIHAPNGLEKLLEGSLSLANASHMIAGNFVIKAGTLVLVGPGGDTPLGNTGTSTLVLGDTTGSATATLAFNNNNILQNNLIVQPGSSGLKSITSGSSAGFPTYSGNFTLNDTLAVNSTAALSNVVLNNSLITIATGKQLVLNANGTNAGLITMAGKTTGQGSVTTGGTTTGAAQIVFTNSLSDHTGGTTLGPIGSGSGLVIIAAGGTSVAGPFGSGPVVLNGANLRADTVSDRNIANPITLGASTTIPTMTAEKNLEFSGPVTLGGSHTLTVHTGTTEADKAFTISGSIGDGSNSFGLTKAGSGTLVLSGDNTFNGNVTVNAGTLRLGHSNALGTGSKFLDMQGTGRVLQLTNGITLGSGVTLRVSSNSTDGGGISSLNGNNTIQGEIHFTTGNPGLNISSAGGSSLVIAGNITLVTTSRTLYLGGNSSAANTVLGAIGSTSSEILPVVKQGTGTWIFAGTNTYTGTTSINQGTLIVNGSIASSAAATVASGATLGGTGTLASPTSVLGTLSPGHNNPGTLGISGTLSFGATSILAWEPNGNTTVGADRVNAGATTVTSGAKISLTLNRSGTGVDFTQGFWASPKAWTLLSAASLSGAFTLDTASADLNGRPASAYGTFSLAHASTNLTLNWTPRPLVEQWRYTWFGTNDNSGNAADSADPDNDGFTNAEEFTASTNPTSQNSFPPPTLVITSPTATMLSIAANDILHLSATLHPASSPLLKVYNWTTLSGPSGTNAVFADGAAALTTVTFPLPGVYILQCSGSLGSAPFTQSSVDEITVLVGINNSISLRQGVADYTHQATFIRGDTTNWNSGMRDQILVGRTNAPFRSLLSFERGTLPLGATINSASLALTIAQTGTGTVNTLQLRPLIGSFIEGSGNGISSGNGVNTGADWLNRSYGPSIAWAAPGTMSGTDYSTTLLGSLAGFNASTTLAGTVFTLTSPELASAADNAFATNQSLGLLLSMQNDLTGSNLFARFASDDHAIESYRPLLTIGYSMPGPPNLTLGTLQSAVVNIPTALTGSATNATLGSTWEKLSGPGNAQFANPSAPSTSVTFTAAGDYILQLTASNSIGTVSHTLAITVTADAFIAWQQETWPGETNQAIIGATADPDNDGLRNELEFAMGLNPKTTNPAPTSITLLTNNSMEFTYSRNPAAAASGWNYQVEWSNTLSSGDWHSHNVSELILNPGGNPLQIKATITLPLGHPSRFARLRLAKP